MYFPVQGTGYLSYLILEITGTEAGLLTKQEILQYE